MHRAGDRGGDLEAEEFLADMIERILHDADDRMAGFFQRIELRLMGGVGLALEREIDEAAIVAIDCRPRRAARRRSGSRPCRSCRSIPRPVARPRRRSSAIAGEAKDRELVAAAQPRRAPMRETERDAGIFRRRHVGPAGAHHHARRANHVRQRRCPQWPRGTRPKGDSTE